MTATIFLFSTIALLIALCVKLGAIDSPALQDASLRLARALPSSTSAVTSYALDVGPLTQLGVRPGVPEFLLTAPSVSTGQLPDGKTFTYDIIHSDNADLSSPSTLSSALIVQTGAGGIGAAAATARERLPSTAKRYLGITITPSASGTGDASDATATLQALF